MGEGEQREEEEIEIESVAQKCLRESTQRTFRGQFAFQDRESGMFFQAFESGFKTYLWQTYEARIALAEAPSGRMSKTGVTG